MSADGAGNTLADARNLGTLSGTQTINDRVSLADSSDYYKFTWSHGAASR